MKKIVKHIMVLILMAVTSVSVQAQEVSTTNMLEMAPYRHYINPAFEPITDGYFYIPALSHLQLYAGNNSLSMSSLIINQGGKTMWTLNPESNVNLLDEFRPNTLIRAQVQAPILGFGTRLKKGGFLHINIDANVDAGVGLPRDLFRFALSGMTDLSGNNAFDLKGLGVNAQAYLSLSVGYSKQVNDHWTWGLNVKVLDGIAHANMKQNELALNASPEAWSLQGTGNVSLAGPFESYPSEFSVDAISNWYESTPIDFTNYKKLLTPSGIGLAADLGFSYKPIKYLKISVALTDIGAIRWLKGCTMGYNVNGTFDGVGTINYSDYVDENGNFNGSMLGDTLLGRLETVYKTALSSNGEANNKGYFSPLTMKLNAGVDAYFANGIIGLGLYSKTMLYNSKFYEELTVGAAVRPASWFNFAVSYSILNGRGDNLGAALGLRLGPLAITLAADYVPMTYAKTPINDKNYPIPYKMQGVNMELGIGIVWGWRHKKSKDVEKIENL